MDDQCGKQRLEDGGPERREGDDENASARDRGGDDIPQPRLRGRGVGRIAPAQCLAHRGRR